MTAINLAVSRQARHLHAAIAEAIAALDRRRAPDAVAAALRRALAEMPAGMPAATDGSEQQLIAAARYLVETGRLATDGEMALLPLRVALGLLDGGGRPARSCPRQ